MPVRSARFPPKARSPVRPSDFGLLSGFGDSDFGIQVQVSSRVRNTAKAAFAGRVAANSPIRLTDFRALAEWKRPDSRSGQDLAGEVRQYFIPDFSNWKNYDAFEQAFDRLLRDWKAEEAGPHQAW